MSDIVLLAVVAFGGGIAGAFILFVTDRAITRHVMTGRFW